MNFKKFGRTANLFDKTTADLNYFINSGTGEKEKLTNYFATDYIRVESGKTYYWQDVQFRNNTGAFYDSNKEYVSGLNTNTLQTYYFTIPTGCEYVRLTGSSSHIEDAMLNEGSTALPYQPYMDWTDIPHYIHNTSTDTITTPADIYANSTTATVGLKGQMDQTGTPTPQNPIQPQECGERTENLWDEDYTGISNTITYKPLYVGNGDYTLSSSIPNGDGGVKNLFLLAGNVSSGASSASNGVASNISRTVTAIDGYVTIAFRSSAGGAPYSPANYDTMLNTGSTPLPYEPYGYKIPILNNSQTTNVYLGEVQSTRRTKKLVFDGTENVSYNARNDTYGRWTVTIPTVGGTTTPENVICTHFKTVNATTKPLSEGGICMRSTGVDVVVGGLYTDIGITAPSDSTTIVNAAKAYLTAQYSAGTPVTVWYVLATETTGIVNEPIRKIGDYADFVSGITIPTIAGANTISVGTTLQPSEVSVNYKGWHPVQSVHERENGAWT